MSGDLGLPGPGFLLDLAREARIGLPEAIFCAGKTALQIAAIVERAPGPLLLTRLDETRHAALPPSVRDRLDYDPLSRTAIAGRHAAGGASAIPVAGGTPPVAIVTAGTSDIPVAAEAARTLVFGGIGARAIDDVGVAGLWRLVERLDELRRFPVVIVAAGMDAALPSVLAGLVPSAIVAVPTSVGYGVATGGRVALDGILASCAPGIAVVNIDNGYGAACVAMRILRQVERMGRETDGTS